MTHFKTYLTTFTFLNLSPQQKKNLSFLQSVHCCLHNVPLQIILAFGNYMNSSRRGTASGFKLATLDRVSYNFYLSFIYLFHPVQPG